MLKKYEVERGAVIQWVGCANTCPALTNQPGESRACLLCQQISQQSETIAREIASWYEGIANGARDCRQYLVQESIFFNFFDAAHSAMNFPPQLKKLVYDFSGNETGSTCQWIQISDNDLFLFVEKYCKKWTKQRENLATSSWVFPTWEYLLRKRLVLLRRQRQERRQRRGHRGRRATWSNYVGHCLRQR